MDQFKKSIGSSQTGINPDEEHCPYCDNEGWVHGQVCQLCVGSGRTIPGLSETESNPDEEHCPYCDNEGWVHGELCQQCVGSGRTIPGF
tara:strand:+ start:36 stop:302 length:267 start_codon:yes stop_codon:yes gene_type:complete